MKPVLVTSPLLPDLDEFNGLLQEIWDSKWITNNGSFHKKLEAALCEYLKVPYVSLFTNGTLPLLTALQALRITGEVITTPYSFVATTHSIWWNGCKPVFVDIDPATGKRADQTEYPLLAIREAVLNALIHRDYSPYTEGTPIQINFFSDRLEIHSPGTLYGRMTVEQLGIARPDLRNPALAVMAETLLKAENRYSGIPTIRNEMAKAGLPPPVFENRRNEFVVTLYNHAGDAPTTTKSENALAGFCAVPRTRQEIAGFLGIGVTPYMMNQYVHPLLEKGILKMTLPDKPKSRNQKYYAPHEMTERRQQYDHRSL